MSHGKLFPRSAWSGNSLRRRGVVGGGLLLPYRLVAIILRVNVLTTVIVGKQTWEPTSICKNCGEKSSLTLCAFYSASVLGNIDTCLRFTELLVPLVPTRQECLGTKQSKVM